MNSNTHSKIKKSKFDLYVDSILKDTSRWNEKVKDKKYKLYKKDSYTVKVSKIYRYGNEFSLPLEST